MQIIIITGAPGAGKTTVAEALSKRLEKSAHVPVDFFRKMIKSGYASPHHWDDEVTRQYALARKNAALTARNLADAGFTVIVDDIVHKAWLEEWREHLRGYDLRLVLLQPEVGRAKERNNAREVWTVDEQIIEELHRLFSEENTEEAGWLVVDNTDRTVEETVAAILKAF